MGELVQVLRTRRTQQCAVLLREHVQREQGERGERPCPRGNVDRRGLDRTGVVTAAHGWAAHGWTFLPYLMDRARRSRSPGFRIVVRSHLPGAGHQWSSRG